MEEQREEIKEPSAVEKGKGLFLFPPCRISSYVCIRLIHVSDSLNFNFVKIVLILKHLEPKEHTEPPQTPPSPLPSPEPVETRSESEPESEPQSGAEPETEEANSTAEYINQQPKKATTDGQSTNDNRASVKVCPLVKHAK